MPAAELRATNLDELEASQRDWVDPCNSFTMGDVHGNIGYLHRGRVPIRNRANGWLPVPGWTGEHECTNGPSPTRARRSSLVPAASRWRGCRIGTRPRCG